MFQQTTAAYKIHNLTKRKRIIQGGTWAGKTYGIIVSIVDLLSKNKDRHLTVVSETIPAVKKGALSNFFEFMQVTGRWNQSQYNATDRIYKFYNGSIIEFNSFDSVGKAQAAGKRTDLFINEAPYIAYDVADALIMRTSGNVWIDFNPTHEFWAHTEILSNPDAEFLLLKYTDNEALPKTIYDELMMKLDKAKTSAYWANWCRVYIDGEIGSLQGVVFDNWKQVSEIPTEAKLIAYGKDFGYTNDPTTLIGVWKQDGELYLKEFLYETGLTNPMICERLRSFGIKKEEIIADSAEPKSIQEIRMQGFNIHPAVKGKDSIASGIDVLQRYKINVTADSLNLIKELRNYKWKQDKDGKTLNEPIDYYNHLIDPLRYVALNKLQLVKRGVYGIT